MKKKYLRMLSAILCCGLALLSCSDDNKNNGNNNGQGDSEPNYADVAVMYYGIGGGDLDYATEVDFMLAANQMSYQVRNVRYFVQYKYSSREASITYDASQKATNAKYNYAMSGEYGSVYRYELLGNMLDMEYLNKNGDNVNYQENGRKVFPNLSQYKFADSTFEMYQPDNLVDFIRWTMKQAPEAKAVVLCLGDHGGAYCVTTDTVRTTRGVMYDDNLVGKPSMTIADLVAALKQLSADELAKLKLINFDCCMMSNLETLGELKDLVPYVMGSSHSVPSADQGKFVYYMGLSQGEETAIAENAKKFNAAVLDMHRTQFVNGGKKWNTLRNLDYTVTDMKKLDPLFASIKNVVDYLVSDENPASPAEKAEEYSKAACECYHYVGNTPVYDIMDYLNKLKEYVFPGNAKFAALVSDVKTAVKAAQYGHVDYTYSLDPENGTNNLGLSYSVLLGCNADVFSFGDQVSDIPEEKQNLGAIMVTIKGGNGIEGDEYFNNVIFEDGHSYIHEWLKGEAVNNAYLSNSALNGGAVVSWAKTYNTTVFDKATGWSKWMRKNPGLPQYNPPFGEDKDGIYDSQNDWLEDVLQELL